MNPLRSWWDGSPMKQLALVAAAAGAIALFAYSVRSVGVARLEEGVFRVGWGFVLILALSGAREAVRALAWMRTIEGPARLRFAHAFRARLAGEALNALVPMGMLIGEPMKAAQVRRQLPFAIAFAGLVVEFAFYSASLVVLFGAVAVMAVARIPAFVRDAISTAALGIVAAGALARPMPAVRRIGDLIVGFASRHPEHAAPVLGLELAYQALGVAEVYVTLMYISPIHPTIAAAVVLESVGRAVTILFKILPMRIGVDETGASISAAYLNLGAATGLTLAVVRKVRLLFWSAIGLLLLLRGSATSIAIADRARQAPDAAGR